MNFKITFHLDGCGIYYDENEPLHLDGLIGYCLAPMQSKKLNFNRDEAPDVDIKMPLLRSKINGHDVWHASALFTPEQSPETLRYWRKRFNQDRVHLSQGKPSLKSGVYRDYNTPIQLMLINKLYAYGSGNRKSVVKLLKKNIKSLGKKRAYGYGKVVEITSERIDKDSSLVAGGVAMRWLPDSDGFRVVRPCPPYWNRVGAIPCCEVGDCFSYKPFNAPMSRRASSPR